MSVLRSPHQRLTRLFFIDHQKHITMSSSVTSVKHRRFVESLMVLRQLLLVSKVVSLGSCPPDAHSRADKAVFQLEELWQAHVAASVVVSNIRCRHKQIIEVVEQQPTGATVELSPFRRRIELLELPVSALGFVFTGKIPSLHVSRSCSCLQSGALVCRKQQGHHVRGFGLLCSLSPH